MKARKKNIIIGVLLSILLVMAIGYAAFSTNLTINSTTNINSTWNVHIQSITVKEVTGTSNNVTTIEGDSINHPSVSADGLTATFYGELRSPGDTITYLVTVKNYGSLKARLVKCDWDAATNAIADTGYIRYTKLCSANNSVVSPNGTQTFEVTATYYDNTFGQTQPSSSELEKPATLILDYVQAE